MKIHVWVQDVAQQVAARTPVATTWRPKSRGESLKPWHILQGPIGGGGPRWSADRRSEQIRVPMFPYRLNAADLDVLFRFGTQLTAAVIGMLVPQHRIEELVIIHSKVHPRDDGLPGYQLWVGVAVMFEGS